MNTTKILLGFVAGAAIGGILGILFAPDKGTETRRKLAEKSSDLSDTLRDKFGDFVDGVKDNFTSAKNRAEDLADKGTSAFNKMKSDKGNAMA
jgi:gas vesicle protein